MLVKIQTHNKAKSGLLGLIALFTCLLEIFPNQYMLFNLLTSGMLCIYWFLYKSNKMRILDVVLILFVILQMVGAGTVDRISIFVFYLFLETQELYSKKSIRTIVFIMSSFFIVVVLAYYIFGFNKSFDLTSWDRVNSTFILQKGLGFENANRCMLYLFCTSLLIILLSDKISVYVFVFLVNYLVFLETQSRTFIYALSIIVVFLLLLKVFRGEEKQSFLGKSPQLAFLIIFALSIILSLYFSDTVLDDFFVGRLVDNKEYLSYGLSLMGNSKLAELTFDNSYLHMLLTKGVFYTLMYAYLVLCKKRRILTNKEAIVLISLFAVAFMEVIFLKYMVMIVMGYIHNREIADNGS